MVKAAEENETMTEQIIRLKKAKGKVEMKMKEKKRFLEIRGTFLIN